MHKVEIDYKGLPRYVADDKAIDDIKNYCHGSKAWEILREEADRAKSAKDWKEIYIAMNLAGIEGYPAHAFGRRYCLTAYREWMHSKDEQPVTTDEQGFKL
jgi:hypothetical protein